MLLSHAFGLIAHPDDEWKDIKREHSNPTHLYAAYVSILALIAPVTAYISTTQFGWVAGGSGPIKLTAESAFYLSALTYLAMLVGVLALGYMIDWMSRTYGSKHDEYAANGIALVAYSCTPLFLAGFALLYPDPLFNMVIFLGAAAFSAYLLHDGLPIVLNIPEDRAFFFEGAIFTVALVYLVITRIGTVIIWSLGIGPVFVDG